MKFVLALIFSFFVCAFANAAANSVQSFRNSYTSTAVTTGTPLAVLTSSQTVSSVFIFDSSGQTMKLLITSGGNTDTLIISPGGGGFPISIGSGAVITLQAISGTANSGEIDINFFN